MRPVIVAVVVLLPACATSAAGLANSEIEETILSAKSPREFAECSIERMSGNTDIRGDGDHLYVLRFSGYQSPYARWDFKARPGGGSIAELRSVNISYGSGVGDVRACA